MSTPSINFGTRQDSLVKRDAIGARDAPGASGASLDAVHKLLLQRFANQNIRIYEAGGGSMSYLPNEIILRAEKTIVDIEEVQLRNNPYAGFKICGDIQHQHFRPESFDLVVCHNVIEHLERPDLAITHFFSALVPGGLVFIAAPNPRSFSGMVTKYTPHWFHVWFYRTLLQRKDAGKRGAGPFRTIYHPVVSPPRLVKFCRELGYEIIYFKEYETVQYTHLAQQRPAIAWMMKTFIGVLEFVSRKNLRNGDFHIVLQKSSAAPVRQEF